jgi:hypothetical protein
LYDIRRQTKPAFAENHPGSGFSGCLAQRLSNGHLNDSVLRPRWRHDDQFPLVQFVQIAVIGQFLELRHGHQRTRRHTNILRHAVSHPNPRLSGESAPIDRIRGGVK